MAEYRLPEDIKLAALSLVKGYDRRKKEFDEKDLHFTFCPRKVLASIELLEEMGY